MSTPELPPYFTGIQLHYPSYSWYVSAYLNSTEEVLERIREETGWAPPFVFNSSGSVGLFQQLPASSWGSR